MSTSFLQRIARLTLPLAAVLLLGSGHAAPVAAQAPGTTVIPVVVNIYPNSGASEDKAKGAVAAANKILAAADIKLAIVQANTLTPAQAKAAGDDGTSSGEIEGAAGDGKFTAAERLKAYEYGKNEVGKIAGKKGIKVSFALWPTQENQFNPGVSSSKHPVVLIQDQGGTAAQIARTGATLAHEVCHVLGLLAGHVLKDKIVADEAGHAPEDTNDALGTGNLMARARVRRGTALTEAQVVVIKRNARNFGWCSVQFQAHFPAVKLTQGFGRDTDGVAAALPVPPLYDLRDVWLAFSAPVASGTAELEAQIQVAGVPAAGDTVGAVYALGFDVDDDPATGTSFAGVSGIDRIVRTTVEGTVEDTSGSGGLMIATTIEDTASGQVQSLPPAALSFGREFPQDFVSSVPTPAEMPLVSTSLGLSLPPDLLGLEAPLVPVVATAGDDASTWQTAVFGYDQQAWAQRPTLSTYGTGVPTAGQPYQVSIAGLAPGGSFALYLDDTLVLTGTLDHQGSFAGSFVFPPDVPTDKPHFLTALDAAGGLAAGMTCPRWEQAPAAGASSKEGY